MEDKELLETLIDYYCHTREYQEKILNYQARITEIDNKLNELIQKHVRENPSQESRTILCVKNGKVFSVYIDKNPVSVDITSVDALNLDEKPEENK